MFLHEVERVIQLVKDETIVDYAEKLRLWIWRTLSEHYHPKTKQLAGPHSRSYRDTLSKEQQNHIDWAISGDDYFDFEPESLLDFVVHISCPKEVRKRFVELPQKEVLQEDQFILKSKKEDSFYGTTWMNDDVTLASINHECFWTQRRPLIAYWLDDSDEVAVFKVRMLKDGKDFSSGAIYNNQFNNKVINVIKPAKSGLGMAYKKTYSGHR